MRSSSPFSRGILSGLWTPRDASTRSQRQLDLSIGETIAVMFHSILFYSIPASLGAAAAGVGSVAKGANLASDINAGVGRKQSPTLPWMTNQGNNSRTLQNMSVRYVDEKAPTKKAIPGQPQRLLPSRGVFGFVHGTSSSSIFQDKIWAIEQNRMIVPRPSVNKKHSYR